tara:strand:+ start:1102 stop:1416 length:315 start_codon:yes stop_codon:yes gene_type:complete
MYRSQEIMKLFYQKSLSQDIIKYILQIERNLLYKKSIHQWIKSSKLFHDTQKQKFFYDEIKNTFLNEIKEINGNMIYLKKYKCKLYKIRQENKISMLYINSLRF